LVALGAVLVLSACRSRSVVRASVDAESRFAAPADDRGDLCADVGELRVCWDGAHPQLVTRALPKVASPTTLGFRCVGRGRERTCFDRARDVGAFVCDGSTCTQPHPRLPDDGEWTCIDDGGAVVCAGGEPAAGVAGKGADAAWICGERRVAMSVRSRA
jgi:hypothetical protein